MVGNEDILKLYKHCLQQKWKSKGKEKTHKRHSTEVSIDTDSDLTIKLTNYQYGLDIISRISWRVLLKN